MNKPLVLSVTHEIVKRLWVKPLAPYTHTEDEETILTVRVNRKPTEDEAQAIIDGLTDKTIVMVSNTISA